MQLDRVHIVGGGPAGLFTAALLRHHFPSSSVVVHERTVPDETFGFGVAFTRKTLELLAAADNEVVAAIREVSIDMPPQEMRIGTASVRSGGNAGGITVARADLLRSLLEQAERAGVEVRLGTQVGLDDVTDADLVVAADGVFSAIRSGLAEEFGAQVVPSRGLFMWLGADTQLDTNLFAPARTEHGLFNIHCYPYATDRSTIGVETDEATWRRASMDVFTDDTPAGESDKQSLAYLQDVFGPVLGGATLLGNRSRWMRFPTVRADRWSHRNIVLVGDAAHTAHYSVGSGTKMAMEDAAELVRSLVDHQDASLQAALAGYEAARRPRVEHLQELADRSRWWWESLETRLDLPVETLMLAYLSRGGAVHATRLAGVDPDLVDRALAGSGLRGSAAAAPELGSDVAGTPWEGRGHHLAGRRFDAGEGLRAREVDGDVADPWGPDADTRIADLNATQSADDDVVVLVGDPGRGHVLDRLAFAERVRRELAVPVAVAAPASCLDDVVDGLIAQRIDLYRIDEPRATDVEGVVGYPPDFAARYRAAGLWRDRTLSGEFAEIAARYPDNLALATPDESWTYAELARRAENVAAGLIRAGLQPGERVILQISNSAHAVAAWYGILRAGLVPVCTLAIHREHEIGQIAEKTQATAHLVQADFPGYDLVGLARTMAGQVTSLRLLLTVGDGAGRTAEAVAIESLESQAITPDERRHLDAIAAATDLTAPAVLQLSGGTTGTPKVIPRLHPEYWYNARATAQWWSMGPTDRLAFALPIAHNAGVANALFAAHSVGAALLLSTPQPDQLLPLMARHGATWLMSPPGIMREYQQDGRFAEATSLLRTCVLTAAPVTRELFDGLQACGVHVTQAFGMSEGLFVFTPLDAGAELRARTVGSPISPADEVRLLEPGTEDEVPDGEVGELCVRGPYTVRGYLAEPERNAEAFTSDGFYRSGDLAMRLHIGDEVGYVLSGRTKDLINRGGEKINADEIETLLLQHPDIADAALVAVPDDRLGERACAFVVVADGAQEPTVATLAAFLGERGVAKFKWPERVEVIDALPRTSIGKVKKLTLRDLAASSTRAGSSTS